MNRFEEITGIISSDLENFENLLNKVNDPYHEVLDGVLNYVFEIKGKRIRPALVYLISRLFGNPTKSTDIAALLVEIIHTATLLHDDVIDEAAIRRGRSSVNYKWNDKTAILSGDFLFAKAMKVATDNKEYRLFDIITPAIINLSMGELMQMKYSQDFLIDEDKYYEVIKCKTASLISVCCEAGAYSTGANKYDVELCRLFGEKLGCIFQIKDDILDYVGNNKTGKQIGIDIKEKKITLPLICAWKNMTEYQQDILINLWNSVCNNPENIQLIIKMVVDNNGISDCEKIMYEHKDNVLKILDNFEESKSKLALVELLDFIIERDK
jgi:octaprenyl-diphosphate synthase